MPTDLTASAGGLLSFLLVLARVSGAVAFVPFPGMRSGPDSARISFSILMTWCLRPVWPAAPSNSPGIATLSMWVFSEAAFGVTLGLFVSFLVESFQLGAQMLSLQAGYSYASTIDPNTQADSGVITVVVQLMAGVCFFVTGADGHILRALAGSLSRFPPGTFSLTPNLVQLMLQAGTTMFMTGLRIALPVIAFLLLVDIALALLGRVQSQLQLLSLAFPAKMLISLMLLASLAALFPRLFQNASERTILTIQRVLGG